MMLNSVILGQIGKIILCIIDSLFFAKLTQNKKYQLIGIVQSSIFSTFVA